jgi:uncharacterized protein (TIGR02271 family)
MSEQPKNEQPKNDEIAVPVVEEELVTGTRAVKTGSIRVKKRVERIRKSIDMPVVKDAVTVERVPVNRVVQTIPQMREERGMLIIPVVEEQLVVRRRLVLREEIHVVRGKVEERAATEVTLAREHAFLERLDSDGKVIARSKPKDLRKSAGGKFFRQNGVL